MLQTLAAEIARLNDPSLAEKLLQEAVRLDPDSLEPRMLRIELAFQVKDKENIEAQIKEIKQIEGDDGPFGRSLEIQFALWQAEQPTTKPDDQKSLRSTARQLINDLSSRRPNWPQIPVALATLDDAGTRPVQS